MIEAFLQELSELSRKHGIMIGGCGCCGSPWLMRETKLGTYQTDKERVFRDNSGSHWDGLTYVIEQP